MIKEEPFFDNTDTAIIRDEKKCISCGLCRKICLENNGLGIPCPVKVGAKTYFRPDEKLHFLDSKCTRCGQCVMVCPTGALSEKDDILNVEKLIKDKNKIVVAQIAPSLRVSLGEAFGQKPGEIMEGQMISGLKKLGFDFVFDVNLGADFTTYEEAHDLLNRIKSKKTPLFTSCCPARVKFIEDFHPELIPNITTVRSPQQCLAVLIKTYFAKQINKNPKDIAVVSIMPCVAKKFESRRENEDKSGYYDVDFVLTTREFIKMLKNKKIDISRLEKTLFDAPLGQASGAGAIYGATGGVMESAVRTLTYIANGQDNLKIDYEEFRGMEGIKKANIKIGEYNLKIAITAGLRNARKLIMDIKKGIEYHYIEVMACPGGCVGGGGQPKPQDERTINARRKALYEIDRNLPVRCAHENPVLKKVYKEFLGSAGSEKAIKYLHTKYE